MKQSTISWNCMLEVPQKIINKANPYDAGKIQEMLSKHNGKLSPAIDLEAIAASTNLTHFYMDNFFLDEKRPRRLLIFNAPMCWVAAFAIVYYDNSIPKAEAI